MASIVRKTRAYIDCLRRVIAICRRPGGEKALLARLADLERELNLAASSSRCDECGSTDLEPTTTTDSGTGVQVSSFRCKACGHEFSAT